MILVLEVFIVTMALSIPTITSDPIGYRGHFVNTTKDTIPTNQNGNDGSQYMSLTGSLGEENSVRAPKKHNDDIYQASNRSVHESVYAEKHGQLKDTGVITSHVAKETNHLENSDITLLDDSVNNDNVSTSSPISVTSDKHGRSHNDTHDNPRQRRDVYCSAPRYRNVCPWRYQMMTNSSRIPHRVQTIVCDFSSPVTGERFVCRPLLIERYFKIRHCTVTDYEDCVERVPVSLGCYATTLSC